MNRTQRYERWNGGLIPSGRTNFKELNMSDGGKGSSPRPYSVSNEEYKNRWDAIFGRDLKKDQEKALDDLVRNAEELGLYEGGGENPLIKK